MGGLTDTKPPSQPDLRILKAKTSVRLDELPEGNETLLKYFFDYERN